MDISDITRTARKRLAGDTGFFSPKVVGISLENGLYYVTVEISERPEKKPGGGALRTYDVVVDQAGDCHGYAPVKNYGD